MFRFDAFFCLLNCGPIKRRLSNSWR